MERNGRTWQFPLKQAAEMEMRNENSVRKRYKMAEEEGSSHKLLDNIAELRESSTRVRENKEREQSKAKGNCN